MSHLSGSSTSMDCPHFPAAGSTRGASLHFTREEKCHMADTLETKEEAQGPPANTIEPAQDVQDLASSAAEAVPDLQLPAATPSEPAPEAQGLGANTTERSEEAQEPVTDTAKTENPPATEERTPTHTVYLHNLEYRVTEEDLIQFCRRYGDVKDVWYPLSRPGMAFCTFYDIRSAIRCVQEGNGRSFRHRTVKINFAFRPPAHSKRDPRDVCSTILVKSEKDDTGLTLDRIKTTLSVFGEVRSAEQRAPGEYVIKFFNLTAATKCAEAAKVNIKGETITMEMLPEADLGDEHVPRTTERHESRRYEGSPDRDRRGYDDRDRRAYDDRGRRGYDDRDWRGYDRGRRGYDDRDRRYDDRSERDPYPYGYVPYWPMGYQYPQYGVPPGYMGAPGYGGYDMGQAVPPAQMQAQQPPAPSQPPPRPPPPTGNGDAPNVGQFLLQ